MSALQSTEANRLTRLQKIGSARNSLVLSYLTSIRDGSGTAILDADNRILERHLAMALKKGVQNIDLILCTNGGAAEMGWNFHSLFREYFPNGKLGVFVPHVAYSAGTQICLGCDEIIMGKGSVLGPVDTQYGSAFGGLMDLINDCANGKRDGGFEKIIANSSAESALTLGRVYRMWKEDRRVIIKALESRRKPLNAKENEEILNYFHNVVGYHGQGVRRKEAIAGGLSFVKNIEDTRSEEDVKSLFADYAKIMRLFDPKTGADNSLEKAPIAIVESEFETNVAYMNGRADRLWEPGDDSGVDAPAQVYADVNWTSEARETPPTDVPRPSIAGVLQRFKTDRK